MANIGHDIGWAGHEDIDYKLVLFVVTSWVIPTEQYYSFFTWILVKS